MTKVKKAVIAAAGFGTRFLPWTKAMPKEMLPLNGKPIIQYVVEELVDAGIEQIYIIGSSSKRPIEDHFDVPNGDLLENLKAGGAKKMPYITMIEDISELAKFSSMRQKGPYGNATPIVNAAHLIGDEPFIYTFADDFFVAEKGRTKQLIETYEKFGGSVLACKKITDDREYDRYGVVAGEKLADSDSVLEVQTIDEKPGKEAARSDLASVSGYLFEPELVKYLEKAKDVHSEGEFMIQPVIQQMIDDGYKFYAREIVDGKYYDTGDKLEYLKTVIDFAYNDEEFGDEIKEHVKNLVEK